MFRFIKIAAIAAMFFTGSAFADGWGHHHHHYGYGYGYNYGYRSAPYYGGGAYIPPAVGYYPAQQPYYAPPAPPAGYYGYVQQMPMQGYYRGRW